MASLTKLVVKTTARKQLVDITDKVADIIIASKIKTGICQLFIAHTTAAITTADLDPGTDKDYLDAFEKLMPELSYRHSHNPNHVVDHILSSIIGPSLSVFFENEQIILGAWQRIVIVELDGPRERNILIRLID
jgi:secondary thiamine-phosphate synthase enzyme